MKGFTGCPGSKMMNFQDDKPAAGTGPEGAIASQLRQWPIQLHLISPAAPYYQSADVVHAAAVAELLEALPPAARERASGAAQAAVTALWRFLDSQDEASPRSS